MHKYLLFKNLVQMSVFEAHIKSVWYLLFQIGIQSVSVWFWFGNFLKVASLVRALPWDLPSTIFSGFLPLNCVICIFVAFVRMIFAMWEDGASLQHGSGLTLG